MIWIAGEASTGLKVGKAGRGWKDSQAKPGTRATDPEPFWTSSEGRQGKSRSEVAPMLRVNPRVDSRACLRCPMS